MQHHSFKVGELEKYLENVAAEVLVSSSVEFLVCTNNHGMLGRSFGFLLRRARQNRY
jgi:hypothetical protein